MSMTFEMPTHTGPCPKCNHVRSATDDAPAWQCPKCGVAYHKVVARDGAPSDLRSVSSASDDMEDDEPARGGMRWKLIAIAVPIVLGAWYWSQRPSAQHAQKRQEVEQRLQQIDALKQEQAQDQRMVEAESAFRMRKFKQALPVFEEFARQGNPRAMMWLSRVYGSGDALGKDINESRRWLEEAVDRGYPVAYVNKAFFHERGEGGYGRDLHAAHHWYRKAAAEQSPSGLFGLATMYAKGTGVMVDTARAYALYAMASRAFSGSEETQNPFVPYGRSGLGAAAEMDYLKRTLSPGELQKAELLASEWLADPKQMLKEIQ